MTALSKAVKVQLSVRTVARKLTEELPLLQAKPEWASLAAVRNGRVYFADGNAYFKRPGARLADSAEMLSEMLHPDRDRVKNSLPKDMGHAG